jgi:hypothetical protein
MYVYMYMYVYTYVLLLLLLLLLLLTANGFIPGYINVRIYLHVCMLGMCVCMSKYVCVYVCFCVCMYVKNVTRSSNTTLADRQQCIIYYFDN